MVEERGERKGGRGERARNAGGLSSAIPFPAARAAATGKGGATREVSGDEVGGDVQLPTVRRQ